MSQVPAVRAQPYHPATVSSGTQPQNGSTGNSATPALAADALDQLSLSKQGIDLSAQGMSDRASELGGTTLDVAQNFLSSFAQQLFGDAANGASVSYDSASLESSSAYTALQQTGTGGGALAGLSLDESSHFIGKGTLTTADGQQFDFEIDVQYTSHSSAVAESGTTDDSAATSSGQDGSTSLPTVQLPNVAFPGSLDDLFKLLGQQLQSNISNSQDGTAATATDGTGAAADGSAGTLLLRLRNLLNHNALSGTDTTAATDTAAQSRAKAVAETYGGTTPSSGTTNTDTQ